MRFIVSSQSAAALAPLATLLTVVLAGALGVSISEGSPDRLPGIALGSTVLLCIERATALFALVVAILSILTQAVRGRLPTQFTTTGLAYEAETTAAAAALVTELQRQVEALQYDVSTLQGTLDRVGPLASADR